MANQIRLKRASGSDPTASDLVLGEPAVRTDTGELFFLKDNGNVAKVSGGGGVEDGDKGDITVSNSGDTFTIDNGVVTTAKIAQDAVDFTKLQNISTNVILGRNDAGTGITKQLSTSEVRTLINVEDGATADQTASEILTLLSDQNISTTGTITTQNTLTIGGTFAQIFLQDSNNNPDYRVQNSNGTFIIKDDTNSVNRFRIASNGTVSITNNLNAEGGIDVTGDITGTGNLILTSTDAGSEASPVIELYRNSASPADADYLGQLKFTGEDDAGAKEIYAKLTAKIDDASSGTEDGILEFTLRKNSTNNICARFTSTDFKLINGTGLEVAGETDLSELLTVTRTSSSGSDPIVKVLHSNLSQGIGIGYHAISAIGSNTNVDLKLQSKGSGEIYLIDNVNAQAGIDVTGNISCSGTIDGVDIATRDTLFGGLTSSSGVLTNGVTATTQSAGNNTTRVATTAFVSTAIANLVDSAPGTLNTLNELAAALGDDANFSTTVTNSIATKLPLAGGTLTGNLTLSSTYPRINLTDTNHNSDFSVINNDGNFLIYDTTNTADRFSILANGTVRSHSNFDALGGIDVTGEITGTSDLTLDSTNTDHPRITLHSNATGINKYAIINGQPWNPDALLVYDLDGDQSILTIETTGLGIKRGANSISHCLDVGGTAMIRGATEIRGNILLSGDATTSNQDRTIDFTGFDKEGTTDTTDRAFIRHTTNTGGHSGSVLLISSQNDNNDGIAFSTNASSKLKHNGDVIWDAGNDGSGSGLDADLLDGVQGSSYLRSDTNDTFSGNLTVNGIIYLQDQIRIGDDVFIEDYNAANAFRVKGNQDSNKGFIAFGSQTKKLGCDGASAALTYDGNTVFHAGNDGSGSGLDADTLDGVQGSSYLRSDANDTVSANLNFTSTTAPITTNSVKFNNSENSTSYYTDAVGVLAFDENFYNDSAYGTGATSPMSTFTSNGGGLLIKNEDGWGAILSSTNIQFCEGNFANLKINSNQVFHAGNDGSGSGLDADTLDGVQGSSFVRSDADDTLNGQYTISDSANEKLVLAGSSNPYIRFQEGTTDKGYIQWNSSGYLRLVNQEDSSQLRLKDDITFSQDGSTFYSLWHAGNDGSGSGLNADLLDSQEGSYYRNASNINAGTLSDDRIPNHVKEIRTDDDITGRMDSGFYESSTATTGEGWPVNSNSWYHLISSTHSNTANYYSMQIAGDFFSQDNFYIRSTNNSGTRGWSKIWTSSSDGSGSGLDSDTVDGIQGASLLRSDAADTASGDITFSGGAGAATIAANSDIRFTTGNWTGNAYGKIQQHNNSLYIGGGSSTENSVIFRHNNDDRVYIRSNGTVYPTSDSVSDLGKNDRRWANLYADTLYGDGSNLTGISAGATGGGSDEIFYENGQTVTTNYTITNGKNAMCAGPITINSGVTVTVGSGENLTIV